MWGSNIVTISASHLWRTWLIAKFWLLQKRKKKFLRAELRTYFILLKWKSYVTELEHFYISHVFLWGELDTNDSCYHCYCIISVLWCYHSLSLKLTTALEHNFQSRVLLQGIITAQYRYLCFFVCILSVVDAVWWYLSAIHSQMIVGVCSGHWNFPRFLWSQEALINKIPDFCFPLS